MSAPEPKLSLAEALNFTPDDLAANRAGRLSAAQAERLNRSWRRTLWIVIGLVVLFGLVATTLLFLAQRQESPVLTAVGIVVTVVNAATVGLGAQSYLRTSGDLRRGEVAVVSGAVSHTIRVTGRVLTYVLKVEGQELIVSKAVFYAVDDAKAYRFYRAPSSRALLSAEPA
jgi:hypothetical protein